MKNLEKQFWRRYKLLCAVRILLVFIPQTGYIHPDEYFQSIEVLAGDSFELDSNRPWEFNVTFPLRSVSIPYVTIGLSYWFLKTIDTFIKMQLERTIISPYALVIVPRLLICFLSFLCDYCMYHICVANNEKYKSRLLILSTSFIMIIFGTRTFSNIIEMIFFSLLLYYVSESMIFSNVNVKHHENFKKRYDKSENVVDKAEFHKMSLLLAPHGYRNFFIISTIGVLGVFNRPTFFCFALIPVFFWLCRSIGSKTVTMVQFYWRTILICLAALPTILILVVIDSFYYGYITWGEIGMLDVSIDSFVVPGLNFVRYNWNEESLEQHGKHPVYLHLFVNIPLLFNILGIYSLIGVGDMLRNLFKRKYHLLPTIKSVKGLMTVSMITPVFLLSLIAHQEPRYIIPIIFPMVYLYANKIYEEPEHSIVEVGEIKNNTSANQIRHTSEAPFKIWISINIILAIFYGFIHQGGIYPAYNYLSKEVNVHPNTQYNIFTSHIYSIPYTMLLQPKTDKLYYKSGSKYEKTKRVFLYEEGTKELSVILEKISTISKVLETEKVRSKLLYVLPSSLDWKLNEVSRNFSEIAMTKVKTLYPHLSTEALPDVTDFIHKMAFVDVKNLNFQELASSFCDIIKSFGLSIYAIDIV